MAIDCFAVIFANQLCGNMKYLGLTYKK